jgi:hypothetical protein
VNLWSRLLQRTRRSQPPPNQITLPESMRQPAPVSSISGAGVQTMAEVCSCRDLLDNRLAKKATEQLQSEGEHGSAAMAGLVRELLACRAASLRQALSVAAQLKPVRSLVAVMQDILASDPVIQSNTTGRFPPETIGAGRIGWTDGTFSDIRELAQEALACYGIAAATPAQPKADELPREQLTRDEKKLADLVMGAAAGKVHLIDLERLSSSMGNAAVSLLRQLIESDINGRTAWAAMAALAAVRSDAVAPIARLGFASTYAGTRHYALRCFTGHPTDEAKRIAAELLKSADLRADSRQDLDRFVGRLACRCAGCRVVFTLGSDSLVVTSFGVLDSFSSSVVLGDGSSFVENRSEPDLVARLEQGWEALQEPARQKQKIEVERILNQLSSGKARWWKCRACGSVQQYA